MNCQVFISGGGIAGLTLALKLAQRNIEVIVVEKDETPSVKYKGELLQPKSIEILAQLGLGEQIHAMGHPINTTNIVEQSDEERRVAFHYSVLQHPYNYALMVPHEQLKKMILTAAQQYSHFHYLKGAAFTHFTTDELLKKEAVIQYKNGEVQHISAQFFIGAEGRVSPIRKSLGIALEETAYNHHFFTVSFPRPTSLTEGEMIIKNDRFLGLFPLANNLVRTVYLIKPEEYKQYKKMGLQALFQSYIDLFPALKGYVEQIPNWKSVQLMIPVRHNAVQYVKGNCVLVGDAAHSVHPMAGEGMNLAIQDTDVLGELLSFMYETGQTDATPLHWYEDVRKPRAEFLSQVSHLSALAYSYSNSYWRKLRMHTLQTIAANDVLHFKQMLNLSGLGMWKDTVQDRFAQVGILPKTMYRQHVDQQQYFFKREDYYPWYK